MTQGLRWTIFNTITAFLVAYAAYFHGLIGYVSHADATYVSSVISGIYVILTLTFGFQLWKYGLIQKKLIKASLFIGTLFMGLGLAGTVAGLMISFGALKGFNPSNITPLIQHFFEVGATAPICTLFGICGMLLVNAQVAFVTGKYD